MKTPSIPQEIYVLAHTLRAQGFSLYIAGGWCRDFFAKKKESDIDLFTDALPEDVKKHLRVVGEIGKKYGTCIIEAGGKHYEITTFRKDIGSIDFRKPVNVVFTQSLEEDAARRDFTCNAIYYDILLQKFIDPLGGIADIEGKVLRFVGEPQKRLKEDILRLLRFVRIKYAYDLLDAHSDYRNILKEFVPYLKHLSMERIHQEFEKILALDTNVQALQELKDVGFLQLFLPEVHDLEEVPGSAPWHTEGNVWVHTLMTIGEMNLLVSGKDRVDLVWTMLLHDIGKKQCLSFEETGRVHYYGHEQVGASLFLELASRWKFSQASKKKIHWLIDTHLRVGMLLKMHPFKRHTTMMNIFFPELLKVFEADKRGRTPVIIEGVQDTKKYYQLFLEECKKTKFFTGKDVLAKHPEYLGEKIGETLDMRNNQVLAEIKVNL